MRIAREIFISLITVVAFIIFGIIVGFFGGFIIEALLTASPPTEWVLLDSPIKFTEIVDVDSFGTVEVEDNHSKLYISRCSNQNCNHWIEVQALPEGSFKDQEPLIKKLKSCPQKDGFPDKDPLGIIKECAFRYTHAGSGYVPTYVVFLEDGKIWRWSPQASGTDMPILSFVICPPIGFVAGLIVGGVLIYRRLKKVFVLPV